MRLALALVPALALLAPLMGAPAGGDLHENLPALPEIPDRAFVLAMQGVGFNGFAHPGSPLLEAYLGETVEFALLVPAYAEPHTFHLHGHPWLLDSGRVVDTFLVNPGGTHRFSVVAGGVDAHAGDWMYHCHVDTHTENGMWGIFRVYPYAMEVTDLLPTLTVRLDRLGEPVDGAELALALDGEPVAAHVAPRGGGEYEVHTMLPAGTAGALVVTATHPELGTSVARVGLGGVTPPAPTLAAAVGAAAASGHAGAH